MSRFTLTVKALADLKSIARYTQLEWGTEQRLIYLRQIDDSFHLLAKQQELGAPCDYIRAGYRKHPISNHLIFYRSLSADKIEIIRVLHKRMHVRSNLVEPGVSPKK
ncbi:type II toxin-antitoxin system RelE/ParE family toxin [Agaribacterium haliotis]|uniref:type II toxin-antitoxin system RelE/ParE family toxin n=1 Tax=Agaribacterium haliotis TaxID=2013869 RepID=UPI000BB56E38|nr:type II toxin-antitoxin system RelE/ParE family toxin [Agaribacterium haliotis]